MIPRKWRLAVLNWLGAGYMRIDRDDDCYPVAIETPGTARIDVDGLNFNVMSAQGGVIVQLRRYDRKLDRNDNSTHIIHSGEDVAESIGKIVAMELLRY